MTLNATHDPAKKSWVSTANGSAADFPLQNLPYGVFARRGDAPRGGVAIGDQILDMRLALESGLFAGDHVTAEAAAEPQLNRLMSMDLVVVSALRRRIQAILELNSPARRLAEDCLVPIKEATLHLPARLGAFTDFMTSAPHIEAQRPSRARCALPPCFWHLPIAYNSRASSVTVSGRPVERPHGQFWKNGVVEFGPTQALDYELEFACFIAGGNELGRPIPLDGASDHIFGYCILNDWSARDVQAWESVLGPFQAKVFRTTISPWVVTQEALAPFRESMRARPSDAPAPPSYLQSNLNDALGGMSIRLQARIRTSKMVSDGSPPVVLSDSAFANASWSFEQMVAHHTIGGCNLQSGDLLSSGTLSGRELSSAGCLLEITGGEAPFVLPNGERRKYLEDDDEISMTARADRDGFVSIGFGECVASVSPAIPLPTQ